MDDLIALQGQVSNSRIETAARMALNDTLRWSRTQIRRSIQETHNIKPARLNDKSSKKGLVAILASNTILEGKITAGHQPISLLSMNGVRKTKAGVSVEVIKGIRKLLPGAFMLTKFGRLVFERGQYKKAGFQFSKDRNPIDSIKTVSVATAAMNAKAAAKWKQPAQDKYQAEVQRQISRLIPNGR